MTDQEDQTDHQEQLARMVLMETGVRLVNPVNLECKERLEAQDNPVATASQDTKE